MIHTANCYSNEPAKNIWLCAGNTYQAYIQLSFNQQKADTSNQIYDRQEVSLVKEKEETEF